MLDLSPFADFRSAASTVLTHLYQRFGFNLWMVTRTEGPDWIVLQAMDHGYGVQEGDVFRWADSFCSRLVLGQGPRIAPRSTEVPAFRMAPIGRQMPIGAYVGVPLVRADGSLFGTLCGIHPSSRPEEIATELPVVELLARLLGTILEAEIKAQAEGRRAERAEVEALTDALTGLWNRRAWDKLLAAEESRCRRYGHPAVVVSIDLDGLKVVNDTHGHARGDDLLCRAAQALRQATREPDLVARLGGDEFAVLAVECDPGGTDGLLARLREQLAAAGVEASLGLVHRKPAGGLALAWQEADQRMYAAKRQRKQQPAPVG